MTTPRLQIAPGGPTLSRLVAGMMNLTDWQLSIPQRLDFIHACLEMGITTFDHADIYGGYTCEAAFGEALARERGLRDRMELVSKCGIRLISPNRPAHHVKSYDTSRDHILQSVENSLRNLRTDSLDLLLIHRPDPLMDADEVAEAFRLLREAGKVRHFGVSNFTPAQVDLLASRLDFPLVTNQVECSLLHRDPLHDGTFDQCQRLRMMPMIWSPFGGGALFRGDTPQARRLQPVLQQIGQTHGRGQDAAGADQIALAWLLALPSRPLPVLGTGRLDRLRAAVDALDIQLDRETWFALWQTAAGHEVP